MANRVLRDWTSSEKMETLSLGAEVFFTRLIMKADDYGSFHANTKLLKAALFPLKDHTLKQVDAWLVECVAAGLIGRYEVEGKSYIRIVNFGQRLQNMRNAFPAPIGDKIEVTVSHRESPPETKRNEVEVETESETKPQRAVVQDIFFGEDVHTAWEEWKKYRIEIKKKLSPSTEKKQMQFLGGRAGPEAIAIINQSITNGWTGLFELKQQTNGHAKTSTREFGPDAIIEHGKELIDRPGFSRNYSNGGGNGGGT